MIIAISGKSGTGKSFISEQLATFFNAEVISFDKISHQTLEDDNIKNQITAFFGNSILKNNKINRKLLGKIVFNNEEKLNWLNNLCEQKMVKIIDEIMQKNKNKNFIFDYALLPKMKYFKISDYKILIKSSDKIRKSRIIKRDNISEEYFFVRDKNSIDYKESDFDLIIENNNDLNIQKIANKIKEDLC